WGTRRFSGTRRDCRRAGVNVANDIRRQHPPRWWSDKTGPRSGRSTPCPPITSLGGPDLRRLTGPVADPDIGVTDPDRGDTTWSTSLRPAPRVARTRRSARPSFRTGSWLRRVA